MRTLLRVAVLSLSAALAAPSAAQQAAPSAPAAPQQPASLGVTFNAFVSLKPGMTADDVARVIGRPGRELSRAQAGGYTTVSYQWMADDMSSIMVTLQNDAVINVTQMSLKPPYPVRPATLATHAQLRQGMTLEQAMDVLGPGIPTSMTRLMNTVTFSVSWPGESLGSMLLVTFQDGKLASSMQAGLR